MKLSRTRRAVPRVEWLDSTESTNAALRELVRLEGASVQHGTLIATADQVAGRGRLDRGWQTPAGLALAVSMLVRGFGADPADIHDLAKDRDSPPARTPPAPPLPLSWLPLLAGSAVAAALRPFFAAAEDPVRVGVKWPNDVHVRDEADAEAGRPGRKLCGILSEVVPGGDAVIVGMGINLLIPEWELPTERATSVLAAGGDVGGAEHLSDPAGEELADRVLAGLAEELLALCGLARSSPRVARNRVLRDSLTLGTEVRVHLPGGELVDGRAVALDTDGALVVDLPTGGQLTVGAADVEHLR